jgi:hypothetical protein
MVQGLVATRTSTWTLRTTTGYAYSDNVYCGGGWSVTSSESLRGLWCAVQALLTPEEQAELDRFFRGGDGEGGDDVSLLEMGEVYAATVFLNTADRSRLTAEGMRTAPVGRQVLCSSVQL